MANANRWSYSAGERGRNRVRAYEEAKTGILYLEFYEETRAGERKRKRVSLGHRDREKAKRQADELAAKFGRSDPTPGGQITLRELFDIYLKEVMTPEKSERQQAHDRRTAQMMLRFFGPEREARTLNRRDWDAFIRERRCGRLSPAGKAKATEVSLRTVERDLKWLRAVLNWATKAGDGSGGYLLDRSPLDGLPYPKEESPNRPVMSDERYQAMLEAASEVDWRFELALVLAHETGHRIGAIRHLRWSDINLAAKLIRWRGEEDKNSFEHDTPLSETAVEVLQRARGRWPAIGDAVGSSLPRKTRQSRAHAISCATGGIGVRTRLAWST